MINVSEASVEGVTAPNTYVKKVSLKEGPSLLGNAGFRGQGFVRKVPSADGTIKEVYNRDNISPKNPGSTSVTVEMVVKDVINSRTGKGTWSTATSGQAMFNLKCLLVFNKKLEEYILSNNIFDYKGVSIPPRFNRGLDWDEAVLPLDKKTAAGFTIEDNEGSQNRIVSKQFTCSFGIPQYQPDHLTCFVYSEYNKSISYGAGAVHSMVVMEKIIESAAVVRQSTVFRDPSGKVWAGPVHYHQGAPMEGAFHTSRPHNVLSEERVYNSKIADFRVFNKIDSLDLNLSPTEETLKTNYVSDLYLTRDKQGNAVMVFNCDVEKILQHESKYGSLLSRAPRRIKREILAESPILSLSIFRDRVRTKIGLNRLTSTAVLRYNRDADALPELIAQTSQNGTSLRSMLKYNAPGEKNKQFVQVSLVQEAPKGYSLTWRIQEINVNNVGSRRTIYAVDSGISMITDGVYEYRAAIKIKDGILPSMRRRLKELQDAITFMDKYINTASRSDNYNRKTQMFSDAFKRQYAMSTQDRISAPQGAIIIYLEVLSLLAGLNNADRNMFANDLHTIVEPGNGTLEANQMLLDRMIRLSGKFGRFIGALREAHTRNKSAIRGADSPSDIISLSLSFPQTFDADLPKNIGISYVNFEQRDLPQLSTIQLDNFKQAIDSQLETFSTVRHTQDELIQAGLSANEIAALQEETTRYSYVSPSEIYVEERTISLIKQKEIDYATVSVSMQSILSDPTSPKTFGKPSAEIKSVLGLVGKGTEKERLKRIKVAYNNVAEKSKIFVSTQNPDLRPGAYKTISSEQFMGGDNGFSSVSKKDSIQPTTKKGPQEETEDAVSVFENILSFNNIGLDGMPSFTAEQPIDISFDLSKNNNYISKNLRPMLEMNTPEETVMAVNQTLQNLPQPIKNLTLNKTPAFASGVSTTEDSKTSGFDVLVRPIRVVEYLHGYFGEQIKNPDWRVLQNAEALRGPLLCRVRNYDLASVGIDASAAWNKIPVRDEYFILLTENGTLSIANRRLPSTPEATEGLFYSREQFSTGRSLLLNTLLSREQQSMRIQKEIEFASTSKPLAPTGPLGKITGLVKE